MREGDLVNNVRVDDKVLGTMPLIISMKEKLCGDACIDHIAWEGFKRLSISFVNSDFEV